MPRRKFFMRRRAAATGLTDRIVAFLYEGPRHHTGAASDEEARPLWAKQAETLMRWWFEGFPPHFHMNEFAWLGRSDTFPQPGRPWAWWRFSAPTPRRLLYVWDDRQIEATADLEQRAHALGLGRSSETHEHANGVGYVFESDFDYLRRHGLLTEREKAEGAASEVATRSLHIGTPGL